MTHQIDTLKDTLGEIVFGYMRGGMTEDAAKAKAINNIRATFGPVLDATRMLGSASRRLSRDDVREMKRMRAAGARLEDIASRFSISKQAAWHHVSRHPRKSPSRSTLPGLGANSSPRVPSASCGGRGAGEVTEAA